MVPKASAKFRATPPKHVRILAVTVEAFGLNGWSTLQMISKLDPPITTGDSALGLSGKKMNIFLSKIIFQGKGKISKNCGINSQKILQSVRLNKYQNWSFQ